MSKLARKFDSMPFQTQLLALAVVLDPLGFAAGYLLGPSFGLEPIVGGAFGLVAASVPMSMHVMRQAT